MEKDVPYKLIITSKDFTVDDNVLVTISKQVYSFNYDDTLNKITLKNNNIIYERDNNVYYFKLDSHNKKGLYLFKEKDISFDINVKSCNYKNNDNNISLTYQLESQEDIINIKLERK